MTCTQQSRRTVRGNILGLWRLWPYYGQNASNPFELVPTNALFVINARMVGLSASYAQTLGRQLNFQPVLPKFALMGLGPPVANSSGTPSDLPTIHSREAFIGSALLKQLLELQILVLQPSYRSSSTR
jgi:hypothetical protein